MLQYFNYIQMCNAHTHNIHQYNCIDVYLQVFESAQSSIVLKWAE